MRSSADSKPDPQRIHETPPFRSNSTRLETPVVSVHQARNSNSHDGYFELDTGFTFFNAKTNSFQEVHKSLRRSLLHQVQTLIPQVVAYQTSFPFILFEYDTEIPSSTVLPFKVAGCFAVFIDVRDGYPWGTGFLGHSGLGNPQPIASNVALRGYTIPSLAEFKQLFLQFPIATHISSFPNQLLVELSLMDDTDFERLLQSLPYSAGGLPVGYYNGAIFDKKCGRVVEPDLRQMPKLICDETNYLKNDNGGGMRPGCAIFCPGKVEEGEAIGACWSNSGVSVKKNGDTRFTVALHTFDDNVDMPVYHGSQIVGKLVDQIGEDIGLVASDVLFENICFDGTVLGKLQRSENLRCFDLFMMDAFVTGRQILSSVGIRCSLRRPSDESGPSDRDYVVVEQGIFATGANILKKRPFIRGGTCGTPLVRIAPPGHVRNYDGVGDVLGFMLWNDVKMYDTNLYCFSEPVDELLDAGWLLN